MNNADDLSLMSTEVSHCSKPMRYVNSRTTWEGQPRQGYETTETHRRCECGAILTTVLREPA